VTALSTRPSLYYCVRQAIGTYDDLCIRQETELVIEGFPRSANSTTVYDFLNRQSRPVRVAHHKHHAAQLQRAVAWRVPAVVLIRRPSDAVLSLLALAEEGRRRGDRAVRERALTFADAAFAWVAFYRAVLPQLDALVIAPFDQVTQDVAPTIGRINDRFATAFETEPSAAKAPQLGWHARPNPLREHVKADLRTAYLHACEEDRQLRNLMCEADELYARILERHERRP